MLRKTTTRLGSKISNTFDADGTYRIYWKIYGGFNDLKKSKYVYIAIAVTALCAPLWLNEVAGARTWPQIAIDIIPGLLGLTLGGMAIMLAFSNKRFWTAVTQKGNPKSLFMKGISAFFHFIVIQSIGLILALISKTYSSDFLSAFGFLFLTYGILGAVAIAGLLLHISRIWNAIGSIEDTQWPSSKPNKYVRISGIRRKRR